MTTATNDFNTFDPMTAMDWLQHEKYDKYNYAQKVMILGHLSEDCRVQNPHEYDNPRVECEDAEFFELFRKGAQIPDGDMPDDSGDDD